MKVLVDVNCASFFFAMVLLEFQAKERLAVLLELDKDARRTFGIFARSHLGQEVVGRFVALLAAHCTVMNIE